MADPLSIGNIAVRQHDGLYSLNDLHKASGEELRHRPVEFIRLEQTQELINELRKGGDSHLFLHTVKGRNGGTYACRELVIAYAAWISASFHLKVIRVFLAVADPQFAHDSERIHLASKLAAEAVACVYRTVFDAVLAGDKPREHDRYLLSMSYDHSNRLTVRHVQTLGVDKMIVSLDELPDWISGPDPVMPTDMQLARLIAACAKRQEARAQHSAEQKLAQRQAALMA